MKPVAFIRKFADEMECFFNLPGAAGGDWCPAVDVREENGVLRITADVPGVKSEDIKVCVSAGSVVLEGERKTERTGKREGHYKSECAYGYFYRSLPLPAGADPEKASAGYANGVLDIRISVSESKNKTREIPVKSAA